MNKIDFLKCSVVCLCISFSCGIYAQVVHAFSAGDTVYRYKSNIYKDYRKFSDIKLFELNFPCVEEIGVFSSAKPQVTYDLVSNVKQVSIFLKGTVMSVTGYEDVEPYFGLPNYKVSLQKSVPISRSTHKDDFYNKVKSEVTFVFRSTDLNGEIRIWADKNKVTEFKAKVNLQWVTKYKHKDSFDNLDELVEGFVIENKKTFTLNTLEIKKGNWEFINANSNRILSEAFSEKVENYYSFFDYRSLAEVARLNMLPILSFEFNTLNEIGNHRSCKSEGKSVYLFPNPTYGDVKLKFLNATNGHYSFDLVNIIGKAIWSHDFIVNRSDQEILLPIPNLSKGMYLYVIKDQDGKSMETKRLMVVDP